MVSLIDTEESQLTVQFDGRDITYDFAELDELVLAYATTRTTSRSDGDLACSGGSSSDSPLERVGFEPVVRPFFFIVDQAERPYPACFADRSKLDLIRIHLLLPVCLPEAQEFRTLVSFEPAAQLTEGKMKGERGKPS
jgi:hypothetical protein